MSRRFVNMIVTKWIGPGSTSRPAYSLHRINPWRCFYPTTPQAAANNKAAMEDDRLPRAAISFYRPCLPLYGGRIHFMSLGSSSNDIISMDQDGKTLLYEGPSRAIRVMPAPNAPKITPISLAVGNSLYVIENGPDWHQPPFEALNYYGQRAVSFEDKWCWRSLPAPPFAPDYGMYRISPSIKAYTVVGDSQIWMSVGGGSGTYSFDTTSGEWSRVGDWVLPFCGRVEYAPELGLWFGFLPRGGQFALSRGGQFAASDLGAASATGPPVLQKVWDELAPPLTKLVYPEDSYLQPLGSGKFCIVRMLNVEEEGCCREAYKNMKGFAVFTGVEVERCRGGALRMIKHKSRRYSFGDNFGVPF